MPMRSPPRSVQLLLASSATVAALAAPPARALDLTVEVTGTRSEKGYVAAVLYNELSGWMKQSFRAERTAAGANPRLVFRDLPAGTYALAVIHDENGNGKLDSNLIGVPTEPYGFSRDARGTFGPPKFEDAALQLGADTTLQVKLQ